MERALLADTPSDDDVIGQGGAGEVDHRGPVVDPLDVDSAPGELGKEEALFGSQPIVDDGNSWALIHLSILFRATASRNDD
jgi:hypothetical protein